MKPLLLAVTLLLCSIAPGSAAEPDWVECRIGDLGAVLPSGAGWELSQRDSGAWVSSRLQPGPTGAPQFLHLVLVETFQAPAIYTDWLPVELATDYLLWEIANMQVQGVDTGEFDLVELDVYEEHHGPWTLHVLRNVKAYLEPWHPDLKLEAQELYLAFLPDFPQTTTFYKIFIIADCFFDSCTPADLDLAAMYPLLDDLRDYSAAPE